MKTGFNLVTMLMLLVLAAFAGVSCTCAGEESSDDDDVDDALDDTADDTTPDDDVDDTDDDADDSGDDDADDTAADDTSVDDTADDDTAADDTGDDDTQQVGSPPQLRGPSKFLIAAADPDFPEYWDEWGTNSVNGGTWNPTWERAAWWIGWYDPDNDLKGGTMFAALDGADPVTFAIPGTIAGSGTWDACKIGLEFTGTFAQTGYHTVVFWVTDQYDNESNHATFHYTVGTNPHGLGSSFTNFTLRGFQKSVVDSTGIFQDYTLSDYLGKVVVIDSFAEWCGPCNSEALQLDQLRDAYSPDDFTAFSLMMDDYNGNSNPVEDADLENWTIYNYGNPGSGARAAQLTGVILNDDNAVVAGPYWLANYVPDNFVLDGSHIVRFKMSGWSKSTVQAVVDAILAE